MYVCLITFRSVTPAQRGEKALGERGISCSVQRTPRWMQEQGCGYSLRLSGADVPRAVELFREKEIPYRKIYLRREGGKWEEMAL